MVVEKLGRRCYNEAFGPDGEVRELYKPLLKTLEGLGPEAVAEGSARANEELRKLGVPPSTSSTRWMRQPGPASCRPIGRRA